jgi:hypothetical protein
LVPLGTLFAVACHPPRHPSSSLSHHLNCLVVRSKIHFSLNHDTHATQRSPKGIRRLRVRPSFPSSSPLLLGSRASGPCLPRPADPAGSLLRFLLLGILGFNGARRGILYAIWCLFRPFLLV